MLMISPEDLAHIKETLDVLSGPKAVADIREADRANARGDVTRGAKAIRRRRR
jgi:PHD/YefM family antitoxin component YafN of YafNO toxin-antitoxin module